MQILLSEFLHLIFYIGSGIDIILSSTKNFNGHLTNNNNNNGYIYVHNVNCNILVLNGISEK